MKLPMDILVHEVLMHHIVRREDGARSLCALRCTCRALNEAGKDDLILEQVNLPTSQLVTTQSDKSYEKFLTTCARFGNQKAKYILGMSYVYLLGKHRQGLRLLIQAAQYSISEPYYVLAMVCFENKSTRKMGTTMFERLNNGSSRRTDLDAIRRRVVSILAKNGCKEHHKLQWRCYSDMCGFHLMDGPKPFGGNFAYYFCSRDCVVANEFYKFVKEIKAFTCT